VGKRCEGKDRLLDKWRNADRAVEHGRADARVQAP